MESANSFTGNLTGIPGSGGWGGLLTSYLPDWGLSCWPDLPLWVLCLRQLAWVYPRAQRCQTIQFFNMLFQCIPELSLDLLLGKVCFRWRPIFSTKRAQSIITHNASAAPRDFPQSLCNFLLKDISPHLPLSFVVTVGSFIKFTRHTIYSFKV